MKTKSTRLLIYFSLALYIVAQEITRINYIVPTSIKKCLVLSAMIILVTNLVIIKRKTGYRAIFFFSTIFLLLFIDSKPSGFHELMYWCIILWCIQNEDIDAIYRFVIIFTTIFTIFILLLTCFGFIENEFVIQGKRIRYNLGFSSYSILAYQYISLVCGYMYFRKKIYLAESVIIELLGYFIYKATNLRTAFILLTIFIILSYLLKKKDTIKWKKLRFLKWLPLIYCFGSFMSIYLYNKGNSYLNILDTILSGRFKWSVIAIERFGIHFLSNYIDWDSVNETTYLIVDNSYLNTLLTWGILGLIFVLLLYMYLIDYALEEKNIILLLTIVVTLTNALLWARLLIFPEVEYILFSTAIFRKKLRMRNEDESLNSC